MGSTIPDTLAIAGIQITGTDSVFVQSKYASGVGLPLNYTTTASSITINQPAISNFINLTYSAKTQFVSDECGSRYVLSNVDIAGHDFDSIRVINPTPGKSASTNIEVFRCPRTNILAVTFRDLYITSSGSQANKVGSISLDRITAEYDGANYYDDATRATYYLPVNLNDDVSSFTFYKADGTSNQLTVTYTRTDQDRYQPCGTQTFVTNLAIANTDFAKASLVLDSDNDPRTTLTDPAEANIYLYRCPRTNLVKLDFKSPSTSSSSGVRTDTVSLKSVKANYTSDVFYTDAFVTTITLPIDESQLVTEFYLEYTDRTDTIKLGYTKTATTLFTECGSQNVYSELTLLEPVTGVSVPTATDSLRFPPVSNVQIINN